MTTHSTNIDSDRGVHAHTQSRAQHAAARDSTRQHVTAQRGDTPQHGAVADGAVGHRHTHTYTAEGSHGFSYILHDTRHTTTLDFEQLNTEV
jgi:hypothetical protein